MTKTELMNADRCVQGLSRDFDLAVANGNSKAAANIINTISVITSLTKEAMGK